MGLWLEKISGNEKGDTAVSERGGALFHGDQHEIIDCWSENEKVQKCQIKALPNVSSEWLMPSYFCEDKYQHHEVVVLVDS